jgi:hypothetical protein
MKGFVLCVRKREGIAGKMKNEKPEIICAALLKYVIIGEGYTLMWLKNCDEGGEGRCYINICHPTRLP